MELRWGLVGPGELAGWVANAINRSAEGRLVACAGRVLDRAERFAREHQVDRVYRSYEELVRDPGIDAVFVATPNHLHHPVVLAAAAAGKHVLCEKPMAPTVREAEEMLSACGAAGVTLRIGFQMRFLPVLQAAAEEVRGGRVGTVRQVIAQRCSAQRPETLASWRRSLSTAGAGVLFDVGVHVIDFVQWIVGDRVARVFAVAHPDRLRGQPDEATTLLMQFAGGCQATIRVSRALPGGGNDLQLLGTRGMLATGPLRWADVNSLTLRTPDECQEREYQVADLYLREIEAFGEELAGRPTPAATGEDGLRIVRVAEAAIRSLETGSAVAVDG